MNRSLHHKIFADTDCLDRDTLIAYRDNQLEPAQMNEVERHLLECDMCSEALAGFMLVPGAVQGFDALDERVKGLTAQPAAAIKGGFAWRYVAAAAVFIGVIVTAFLVFQTEQDQLNGMVTEKVEPKPKKEAAKSEAPARKAEEATKAKLEAKEEQPAVSELAEEQKAAPVPPAPAVEVVVLDDAVADVDEETEIADAEYYVEAEEEADHYQPKQAKTRMAVPEPVTDLYVADDYAEMDDPADDLELNFANGTFDFGNAADSTLSKPFIGTNSLSKEGTNFTSSGTNATIQPAFNTNGTTTHQWLDGNAATNTIGTTETAVAAEGPESAEPTSEANKGNDWAGKHLADFRVIDYADVYDNEQYQAFELDMGIPASLESSDEGKRDDNFSKDTSTDSRAARSANTDIGRQLDDNYKNQLEESNTFEYSYDNYLEKALLDFKGGRYSESYNKLSIIRDNFPNDMNAMFYMGLNLFQLENYQQAVTQFDKVLADDIDAFHQEAEWYKALSLIELKQTSNAKALLQTIKAKDGWYGKQASEKLQQLNR